MEKPKVRFSNDDPIKQQKKTDRTKPKVKSIETVSLPIKISKDRKSVLVKNCHNFDVYANNNKENKSSSIPNIYISTDCVEGNGNSKCNDDEIQTWVEQLRTMTLDGSKCEQNSDLNLEESINEMEVFNNHETNEDSDLQILKIVTPNEANPAKSKQENSRTVFTNIPKKTDETPQNILKDSTNSTKKGMKCRKKLQVMPCAKYKLSTLKNRTVEKMPQTKRSTISNVDKSCYKRTVKSKMMSKEKDDVENEENKLLFKNKSGNKISQIKKSAVFNINGKCSNISILPGMPLKKYENIENKIIENKNIGSKNLLSQPEYNSTICVMKKLKEMEEEKVIRDIEHLPSTYRNLIYGKVTAALDFAPYESAFKDLINLSVDDEQLPARLIRSKDPEPRNRDIVPKLSDFFKPCYADQYSIIVNPNTPSPIDNNTLSAFTISNKIRSWKICRDKF